MSSIPGRGIGVREKILATPYMGVGGKTNVRKKLSKTIVSPLGGLVVAAHEEDGHEAALVSGSVPGAEDNEVGRVGHRTLVQVVLLDLEPVPLARLVLALQIFEDET